MSSGAIIKIELTEAEYKTIIRQVDRMYMHKTRISSREARKRDGEFTLLKALLNRLATLVPELESGSYELNLRRKDARVLEQLCKTSINLLMTSIISGYLARESKAQDPVEKQRYAQYRARAEASLGVFNSVNNKVQVAL